ncbi:MAG: hypothetical protein M1814_005938 [Vezdaea aestivalis]|nr:MAG: hypothetical protein M1814_005938 [Vezdaea aestivalis]
MPPPTPLPPTTQEQRQLHHFRHLRARIHSGPHYTQARVHKRNPFEMTSYTQKYRRANRSLPKLDGPFPAKRFFPKELWAVLEGAEAVKRKKDARQSLEKAKTEVSRQRRIEAVAAQVGEEPAEDQPEEEVDDDFAENESEAGDYNAEAYFDDGDEEDGGGGDEGEGGGEGSY